MSANAGMPNRCIDCQFADHDALGFSGTCNLASDQLKPIDFNGENRPEWCPLEEGYKQQVESEDDDAP